VRYFSTFYDFLQQQKFENIVKNAIFCSEYFFISRSVYIFFLKNKIRNVTIPNFSVRYKEKGAQN